MIPTRPMRTLTAEDTYDIAVAVLEGVRLTDPQRRFVLEYVRNGRNAAAAAREAYPRAKKPDREGARVAHNPNVREAMAAVTRAIDEARGLTKQDADTVLWAILMARPEDALDREGNMINLRSPEDMPEVTRCAIQRITSTPNKWGDSVCVGMYNKIEAYRALAQTNGWAEGSAEERQIKRLIIRDPGPGPDPVDSEDPEDPEGTPDV